MSLSANTERMFIIDMEERILVEKKLVAHGMKTGYEFASKFSNEQSSHKSSLGFFITGELYNGRHDLSMKLDGQEYSNDNARSRGLVVHSARLRKLRLHCIEWSVRQKFWMSCHR